MLHSLNDIIISDHIKWRLLGQIFRVVELKKKLFRFVKILNIFANYFFDVSEFDVNKYTYHLHFATKLGIFGDRCQPMTILFNCKDGIKYPIPNRLDGKIGIGYSMSRPKSGIIV
jgi:hypothetical protein